MNCEKFEKNHLDLIGNHVWICDYRHLNISEKPIRHIKPTKVLVVSNHDLPKNKTVYYSNIHFRPIGQKGQPLKQVIAPYDNTGYRSFSGTSVNIFMTREECVECYIEQCKQVKTEIAWERKIANERLDQMEEQINQQIKEFYQSNYIRKR